MKTIFVVDDNYVNLHTAESALSEFYSVFTLNSAAAMFALLEEVNPDLILLDILMPDVSGFDTIKKLKSDEKYSQIPVIFLTGKDDEASEAEGIELGAADFISKPFSKIVLLNRIKNHLNIEAIIRERTERLNRLKNTIISVLTNMVDNRDTISGKHIERTTTYVQILLEAMRERGVYGDVIGKWDMELVVSSARLHDIGKIVITDTILNKPGNLTDEEFEIIKTHASEGERIIETIIAESGDEEFSRNAKLFAGYHHERWDGTGYPYGLKGDAIPLQGRIMALADMYDALVTSRPNKNAFTHQNAVGIIRRRRGTYFDPQIVDAFYEANAMFQGVNL